jgi:hypothetical protein
MILKRKFIRIDNDGINFGAYLDSVFAHGWAWKRERRKMVCLPNTLLAPTTFLDWNWINFSGECASIIR